MAYANHVSHVISILCAIKKFNYLFHLLMKLICWFGFLLFHSLLSSWLSCSFFFIRSPCCSSYLSFISLKPPQLKFSRGNTVYDKQICLHVRTLLPIFRLVVCVCECVRAALLVYRSRQAIMLCYKVDLLACSPANSRNIYYFDVISCWCVFFYRFKRCPHKVTDAFTLLCFGLVWFAAFS